jgi:TonB family protein
MSSFIDSLFIARGIRGPVVTALMLGLSMPVFAQVALISHFVAPVYPALARQALISGQVGLRVALDSDGALLSVAAESSSHPLLLEQAKASVSEWKFQSGARNRQVSVTIYFGFSGTVRDSNPITTVKADFAGSAVDVYVTTDPAPRVRP